MDLEVNEMAKCRAEGYFGYCGDYCVGETHFDDEGYQTVHMTHSFETQEEAEEYMDGYKPEVIQSRDFSVGGQ
jgi:hypothetical protein